MLQRTGNTVPTHDLLQYSMLREMDDDSLTIVCEVVNRYMRGEPLGALSREDLHLLPKKPPHGIGASDRPLTNLVLLRNVVGLVVKEEEQPWLREHGFLPPRQFALWPRTSIWYFFRVLSNYIWHCWGSVGKAWPVLDDVRHAFGSLDHVSQDSVHQVVGYGTEGCRLHRSLVEDMRLDMGGTDDIDHGEGLFDAASGQGCPLSPLDCAPMGEVRAKMVSWDYSDVLTAAGLLHSVAWADETVWLSGSPEDMFAIARALPAAEDAVALGPDVSKMHVLRTWMEGQQLRYGVPSVLMKGVQLPVLSEGGVGVHTKQPRCTGRVCRRRKDSTGNWTRPHTPNHRSARSPRRKSEGPARDNPIAGPRTGMTQSAPSALATVSGRPLCASRSHQVKPGATASGQGDGTTATGKLTGAPRATGPDEARRTNAGPRGKPERHTVGHNHGTRTGAKPHRPPGAANPGSTHNTRRTAAREEVPRTAGP